MMIVWASALPPIQPAISHQWTSLQRGKEEDDETVKWLMMMIYKINLCLIKSDCLCPQPRRRWRANHAHRLWAGVYSSSYTSTVWRGLDEIFTFLAWPGSHARSTRMWRRDHASETWSVVFCWFNIECVCQSLSIADWESAAYTLWFCFLLLLLCS